jgi:hypothetical protein
MKSIYLEKYAPYILAFECAFIWVSFGMNLPQENDILSASLTLGAILTGFMATSKAILMTLDSPIMHRLRDTEYINDVVLYLSQAIWLSFSFCIISLVGFFVDKGSMFYGTIWVLIGVASAGAFIRVTEIMLKIIKHPLSKTPNQE